jgi:hypothetical protein
MRGEFENTVEYESAALEKHVSPVPSVILDDIVSLGFDPEVEADHSDACEPPAGELVYVI